MARTAAVPAPPPMTAPFAAPPPPPTMAPIAAPAPAPMPIFVASFFFVVAARWLIVPVGDRLAAAVARQIDRVESERDFSAPLHFPRTFRMRHVPDQRRPRGIA